MWKLVIEDDEGKRTVVPLSRDDYSIGRQEGNTIRLTERNVSRTHGRIRRSRNTNGGHVFVLEDLRSYNGLFVNGLRVAHTQDLQNGDLVQIGDYRIVLQDDAAAAAAAQAEANATLQLAALDPSDTKATIPIATAYRGQTLTDRPNRLVMLVGPTPGVEYPLDRERMTIGRAEDASISVNHNSVSRLHCEVHALGDGRFEIVDKGSSNGVRVNAVELRRSIIEAGDVIELGDVRFKFVGAGQVFVPGPNESQQLTAISDRDADLVVGKKGGGAYVVPVLCAAIVGAGIIGAFLYVFHKAPVIESVDAGITSVTDSDQVILTEAKAKCTVDDCESSHVALAQIAEASPWRDHADFKWVVSTWAESLLKRARVDPDPASKKQTLTRIINDPKVDAAQKKQAMDLLTTGDVAPSPTDSTALAASAVPGTSASGGKPLHPGAPGTGAVPAPTASSKALAESEKTREAREALAKGDVATVKRLLEAKVRGGHGTTDEVVLLKAACKGPPRDAACVDDIKAKYPNL